MTVSDVYNASVRVRDLPRSTDRLLDMIASARQINKWEVIREALNEFTENHRHEVET